MNLSVYRWFKHQYPGTFVELHVLLQGCMRRHSACLVPRFFTGERVGQIGFLEVLVTGIVTNRKQKIPSQIAGKIMFKPTGHFYSY